MSTGALRRTTIGNYRVVDFLGAGGMGEVYRAVHMTTGRVAAVKMLSNARTPAMVERFRNEGRIQSALTHPHIVGLYDFFEHEGTPCIAMEFIAGESLEQISSRGPIEPTRALQWFSQIVDAVGYVHDRGIVHRDLKANNIKIDEQGRVKLLDFGIAKSGESPKLTTDGSVVGTLLYLSPEQVRGEPASPASDIWALGVVLYEMTTGRVPFASESLTGVMARILKGNYDPPSRAGVALPPDIVRIIGRCLKVAPEQRFASAATLLHDVRQAISPAPPTPQLRGPLLRQVPPFVRQHGPLLASGLAFVLAVVFLVSSLPERTIARGDDPAAADTTHQLPPTQGRPRDSSVTTSGPPGVTTLPGDMRSISIKVFGDLQAEVWREDERLGTTPITFSAPKGAWVRLTLKYLGREQRISPFQVADFGNEYTYTLTHEAPPPGGGGAL